MTTITATTASTAASTRVTWRAGLVTITAGAVAATLVALAVQAAGIGLEVEGEPVPWAAFAQMVALGGIVGIVLARHVGRTTFLRTTVALTVLSCGPSIALGTTVGDKLGLMLTHVVAAAVIVPRLAPR